MKKKKIEKMVTLLIIGIVILVTGGSVFAITKSHSISINQYSDIAGTDADILVLQCQYPLSDNQGLFALNFYFNEKGKNTDATATFLNSNENIGFDINERNGSFGFNLWQSSYAVKANTSLSLSNAWVGKAYDKNAKTFSCPQNVYYKSYDDNNYKIYEFSYSYNDGDYPFTLSLINNATNTPTENNNLKKDYADLSECTDTTLFAQKVEEIKNVITNNIGSYAETNYTYHPGWSYQTYDLMIKGENNDYAPISNGIYAQIIAPREELKKIALEVGCKPSEEVINQYLKDIDNHIKHLTDTVVFDRIKEILKQARDNHDISENEYNTAIENLNKAEDYASEALKDVVSTPIGKWFVRINSDEYSTCQGILPDSLVSIIKEILSIVRIAVPILLILLGSVDFAKAVFNEEKDEMKQAVSRFVKRVIAAVLVFLLPLIFSVVVSLYNRVADIDKNDRIPPLTDLKDCGIN